MRVRSTSVGALFLSALAVTGLAGDGDQADKPTSKAVKEAKDAEAKAAEADKRIALQRPAPKDLDEAMKRLAHVRVNVAFKETSFEDVVDYVRRVAGFNVMVSPVLQSKGADGVKPFTMTLTDVTLRQLVELTAKIAGAGVKFADGVLQFTTPEDARGKPVLRIFSIADLTMRLRNFPGPELDLHPANYEMPEDPETDVPNAWSDPNKVIEMIQKMCGEGTWEDKDVSIAADEHKLIVKQYPEVHREIARLIGALRGAR
jgi:hypothetical protein